MVTQRSNHTHASTSVGSFGKRKRRASCLGEQERRERKRAIDREAQRSLREKTKSHIAELERKIRILRDQDGKESTASLLSEIESLRAENERLRDVIESVKSTIGLELPPRTTETVSDNGGKNKDTASSDGSAGGSPEKLLQYSPHHFQTEGKPSAHLPSSPEEFTQDTTCFTFADPTLTASRQEPDLDGMLLSELVYTMAAPSPVLDLLSQPAEEAFALDQKSTVDGLDDPATAAFAPLMAELFSPSYHCPSPIVLHIDNLSSIPSLNSPSICPSWKKSNELFGKIYFFQSDPTRTSTMLEVNEASHLFLGIKNGWQTFGEWEQSPVLQVLKSIDEFLFPMLPPLQRLAIAYKNFKLLKYYLNATKEDLEKVPKWLRPSTSQSVTSHPIALDFFAWPTLRSRLLATHATVFSSAHLWHCYAYYLHFDWPFSYDDAFMQDEKMGVWRPSPLFDRYVGDIKYWGMQEPFLEVFPEVRGDIEGDWKVFTEVY